MFLAVQLSQCIIHALVHFTRVWFHQIRTTEVPVWMESASGAPIPRDLPNRLAWAEACALCVGVVRHGIRINPPAVTGLALRQGPMVGFPLKPAVSLEFADPALSEWRWYRRAASEPSPEASADADDEWEDGGEEFDGDWEEVGDGEIYTPAPEDINRLLLVRCVPAVAGADGAVLRGAAGSSRARFPTAPGPAGWDELMRPRFDHARRARLAAAGAVRVVSFNVLADTYATSALAREQLYAYCPPDYLQAPPHRDRLVARRRVRAWPGGALAVAWGTALRPPPPMSL